MPEEGVRPCKYHAKEKKHRERWLNIFKNIRVFCPRRAMPYAECRKVFGLGCVEPAFSIIHYPLSIEMSAAVFVVL